MKPSKESIIRAKGMIKKTKYSEWKHGDSTIIRKNETGTQVYKDYNAFIYKVALLIEKEPK